MLTLDTSLAPAGEVVFRDLAGEGVILHLASGHYFGLDPVGTRIWQLITSGQSLRAVREALVAEYDVTPEIAGSDLLEFAAELTGKRLLEPRP